jgi:cytochrome c-type biogenesis protein CcmH
MTMTKTRIRAARSAILATLLLAATAVLPLYAQQTERAKQIGGKFMCMCGCNQVLTQCNHVGCTVSASMLKKIDSSLANGDSETAITSMLVQQYGTTVYAEPPHSGFSLVAWIMPSFFLLLGTAIVIFVIYRWRRATPAAVGGTPSVSPEILNRAREQARKATED